MTFTKNNVTVMLVLRRWPSIQPAPRHCLVFSGAALLAVDVTQMGMMFKRENKKADNNNRKTIAQVMVSEFRRASDNRGFDCIIMLKCPILCSIELSSTQRAEIFHSFFFSLRSRYGRLKIANVLSKR